jgi:CBS domain-containing protein
LIVVLFGIVVLHELGHALTAKRFGIGTRDITLLPIGGVARLERMPEEPKQELLVALAGPAVNVGLALLLFAVKDLGFYLAQFTGWELFQGEFWGISPQQSLGRAGEQLLAGWQNDFPVLEEGRVVGLLTQSAMVDGLAQKGEQGLVGEVMAHEFPVIDPSEKAENALMRLKTSQGQIILVARDNELHGILTSEKVDEFLLIRSALRQSATLEPGPEPASSCVEREAKGVDGWAHASGS